MKKELRFEDLDYELAVDVMDKYSHDVDEDNPPLSRILHGLGVGIEGAGAAGQYSIEDEYQSLYARVYRFIEENEQSNKGE